MKKLGILLALAASLMADTLTLSGTVISDNQKMITSRFMGFVTSVNVSEGDRVKKNQILYTIDSREIDSAKRQAELSLQMYQNQYTNVEINLDRHKRLLAKDMVSKYEVENLELAEKNLSDMINIAKARLQEVENQYKYLVIKAPNTGVIIAKNIKVGEMAIPGMPAVVLSDLSNLKVEIEVAEQDMKSIYVGKKVTINIPSLELKSIGKIAAIIPSSNPMTHTFKIKISLVSKSKNIYPGMYATVDIEVNSMQEHDVSKIKVTDTAGKLAKSFLYNPLTAILAVFLLAIGYISLEVMPREEDPQIALSGGSIMVAAPGLSPKEVEKIVVQPLEQKIREISGVEHIYSMSMENVGIINVMYYIGQNREASNLKLYDKVMQNMDLMPKEVMQPLVKPFDIDIDIPIVNIAFYQTSDTLVYSDFLKTVQALKMKIAQIDNVSKTDLKGEHKQQFNVDVDLNKLKGYHLSLGQIVQAIKAISIKAPNVNTNTKDEKLVVFGVENVIERVEDVQNIMVAQYMGSPIYLKDVATVEDGINKDDKLSARITLNDTKEKNSYSQITLSISKLAGSNAVFVADDVKALLEKYDEELKAQGIGYKITRDYGQRANEAVNELVEHLIITIVIITVMLVFFLGYKESMIVMFTVPAILAATLFVAYLSGQTINRMTLFAFLLSLGLLVDAAIIVIENIHRHLHAHDSEHKTIDTLVVKATDEIGAPTNVATLAIILTMVPMAFVGGMMGAFMKPIPLNVPVALIASLIVAYIFTPYLSRKLLKIKDDGAHHPKENNKGSL